jgi:hypothetical protein
MTEPIANRVRQFDTILRTTTDASLLVQSLLSLVTEKALEVGRPTHSLNSIIIIIADHPSRLLLY